MAGDTEGNCSQVEHVGFMLAPKGAANIGFLKAAEAAAPSLKVRLKALGVHSADEIERSLSAFAAGPNRGLIIAPTAVTFVNSKLIVQLAASYRLPAIYSFAYYPKAGGLISYRLDQVDQFGKGQRMPVASSRAPRSPSYRCNTRPSLNLWSISRPRRCSASRFPNFKDRPDCSG